MKIERRTSTGAKMMVPAYTSRDGFALVDVTWGTIQPWEVAPGVLTVGELDVIRHLEEGLLLVDTRHAEQHRQATIPGARAIPHEEIVERLDELDRDRMTILFCNGPQCAATPLAVRALVGAGYPRDSLQYYRGGVHDWMTLGLPVEGSRTDPAQHLPAGPAEHRD